MFWGVDPRMCVFICMGDKQMVVKRLIKKSPTQKMGKAKSKKKKGRAKASPAHREFQFNVCLWLAMGMTTRQIADRSKDRLGIRTSINNIDKNYRYGKKWKSVIIYLRERYLRNLAHIPIADKAKRISMLMDIHKESMTWRTKTINAYGIIKEIKPGVALQAIEAVRKEIEGDKGINLNIDNRKYQHFDFKDKTGDEIAEFLTPLLRNRT